MGCEQCDGYGSIFFNARTFNEELKDWDVSNVTTLRSAFNGAFLFNQELNNWDVSQVKDLNGTFREARAFNQPLDNWDVGQVENTSFAFARTRAFNQDLSNWNVGKVRNMYSMFNSARQFNQSLGAWDISSASNLGAMLDNSALDTDNYDATLVGWSTKNLSAGIQLGAKGLSYCLGLQARNQLVFDKNWRITGDELLCETRPFKTTWITDDGTIQINVFTGFPRRVTYNLSWKNLTNPGMAEGVQINLDSAYLITGLENGSVYEISITSTNRISVFNTARTPNTKLRTVEQWGDIQWGNMRFAFLQCVNLEIKATDTPDLSVVSNFSGMFTNCISMKGHPSMNEWDISERARDMSFMFSGASSFNQDLDQWDVSSVEDMGAMFSRATSFNGNITTWNVGRVRNMGQMFGNATNFNQDIGQWNTSNVNSMGFMFWNAVNFNQDISQWDTRGVSGFRVMFEGATAFNQNLGTWKRKQGAR